MNDLAFNQVSSSASCSSSSIGYVKRFFFMTARLESFRELGWIFTSGSCDAEQMAAAGFYKLNATDDNVSCAFCDKKLCVWDKDDKPFELHRKHSPECLYAVIGKPEPDLDLRELILLARFQLNNYLVR
jgi:hypothetical protein